MALTPIVEAVSVLHALEGHRVGIEGYLKQMAAGPAGTTDLPARGQSYASMDAGAMVAAAGLAKQHGIVFLSEEEVSQRLPAFEARRAGAA